MPLSHPNPAPKRPLPRRWIVLGIAVVGVALLGTLGWQMQQRQSQRDAQDFTRRVRPDWLRLGQLTFNACSIGSARTLSLKAFCAEVPVPENYEQPQGRRLRLHVALIKAETSQPKSDLVTFLDGGPGGAATEDYPAISSAFDELLKQHHVLLVDQRGTGRSNPLDCPATRAAHPTQLTDELEQVSSPEFAAITRACLEEISQRADPAYYTTSDAVRDLETVRQLVGAPKLNVIGVSYGTRVAQQYAGAYPHAVRSMVLDSVVPNTLALGQDHAVNLEAALQAQLARCTDNPECHARFGDVYQTLQTVRSALRTPITVSFNDPRSNAPTQATLSIANLINLLRLYTYNPATSALLPLILDEAAQGRYAPLLAQETMLVDGVGEQLNAGMALAVNCSEDAPRLSLNDADRNTLLGNRLIEYMQAACKLWPSRTPPDSFHTPLNSDIPTLLLAGENDPVTPPRYAEAVAASLSNARVLLARQQGHAVLTARCMPKLVTRFIVNRDAKALDASCLDSLRAPPAFLNYNGAAP